MRFLYLLTIFASACASPVEYKRTARHAPKGEVVYLSLDLSSAARFSKKEAHFGPADITFSSPAKYFEADDGVQCISVGEPATSIEFAVKRPLAEGQNYRCLGTIFRVVQCFFGCRAAIVEIDRSLSGGRLGSYQSYMYLDDCRGAIILSEISILSKEVPLSAKWLRGELGILAHPDYPKCRLF